MGFMMRIRSSSRRAVLTYFLISQCSFIFAYYNSANSWKSFSYGKNRQSQQRRQREKGYYYLQLKDYNRKMNSNRNLRIYSFDNAGSNNQIDCYGASFGGTDPDRPQKVNQDAYFAFQMNDCNITVICAMDGHGTKGQQVTAYLRECLPKRLKQCLSYVGNENGLIGYLPFFRNNSNDDDDDIDSEFQELFVKQRQDLINLGNANPSEMENTDTISQCLINAFLAAQLDARKDTNIPTGRHGTTCIVCVISETTIKTSNEDDEYEDIITIHTAYVGDSSAILVRPEESNGAAVQPLSIKTTVQAMPTERERIIQSEGRIDSSGNVFYGPVGIAMTRSLGNAVMLRAGVIPVPIITKSVIHKPCNDFIVCVGTDGIFDVLSNVHIADIISSTTSSSSKKAQLEKMVKNVCMEARKAWIADLPIEPKVDDITFVAARYSCTKR